MSSFAENKESDATIVPRKLPRTRFLSLYRRKSSSLDNFVSLSCFANHTEARNSFVFGATCVFRDPVRRWNGREKKAHSKSTVLRASPWCVVTLGEAQQRQSEPNFLTGSLRALTQRGKKVFSTKLLRLSLRSHSTYATESVLKRDERKEKTFFVVQRQ